MALKKLINDLEDDIITNNENVYVSNFIIHDACIRYNQIYKSLFVPESFIAFYFDEYSKYVDQSPKYLKPFFELYDKNYINALIENYSTFFYSCIDGKKITNETYYHLNKNDFFDIDLSNSDGCLFLDQNIIDSLKTISYHIQNSDELVTTVDLYENFMIKNIVIQTLIQNDNKSKEQSVVESNIKLIGEKSEMPKDKGKINKIFFPKLTLPSIYPIESGKSRIDSSKKASQFMYAHKQIKFIEKHKFNQVSYSNGFIEKRKLAKTPKKPKFNFDF